MFSSGPIFGAPTSEMRSGITIAGSHGAYCLLRHFIFHVYFLKTIFTDPSIFRLLVTIYYTIPNIMPAAKMESIGLPKIHRFITTHDSEGKATFSNLVPEPLEWQTLSDGAKFCLGYTTNEFPVEMNGNKDIITYQHYLENKPGITIPGGTVLRFVDMLPGALSPMHRTVSLDYGVVLEGEVELVLDSGETRLMKRGDVAIQRGTNHAWRNASKTSGARMMYVLQESQEVLVGGKRLGEDYGGIPGVRPSR